MSDTEFEVRNDGTRLRLYERPGDDSEWVEVPTEPFSILALQEAVNNFHDAAERQWAAKEQVVPLAEFRKDPAKYIGLMKNGPVRVIDKGGKTHMYMC